MIPDDRDAWRVQPRCRHWGDLGAAGALLVHEDRVLLGRRAPWVMHGGTLGIPGGALDRGESGLDAALRELREEAGIRLNPLDPRERPAAALRVGCEWCPWSYVTYVFRLLTTPLARPMDSETEWWRWMRLDDVELRLYRHLHPGLASAWPDLTRLMRETER